MTKSIQCIVWGVVCLSLWAGLAHAQPTLTRGEDFLETPAISQGLCVHNVFQSNMVLQRDKPIVVWGWATPGEQVSVSFGGHEQSATAGSDRTWKATLPAMPANAQPQQMTISGGKDAMIRFDNILVGDVWVLGGQSNMEHPISRVEDGELEIVSANFPNIRMLTVPQLPGPQENKSFPRMYQWSGWFSQHYRQGYWDVCTPKTVDDLSAIGYIFARRIHMASQVPIGIIDTSIGGTTVETWTPAPRLAALPDEHVRELMNEWNTRVAEFDPQKDLEARIKQFNERTERLKAEGKDVSDRTPPTDLNPGPAMDRNRPGNCYAGLIAPLAGLSVKGAIFHQGYNNCFDGTPGALLYQQVFPEMIAAWRQAFGDPQMPFGILSLCTEGKAQTLDDFTESMLNAGPFIREAQHKTYLKLLQSGDKNIGYVSTEDLRRRWYHPQLKIPAGERIARWALATQYGMNRLQWQPAMVEELKVEPGRLVLKMDRRVSPIDNGLPIEGFAIAGDDRKFHPADASFLVTGKDDRGRDQHDDKTLVLTSQMVPSPVAFRYAWARSPMGNLQCPGGSDVPFPTLRSDDWPMEQTPAGLFGDNPPARLDGGQIHKLRTALRQIDLERRIAQARAILNENQVKVGE